MPHLLMFAQICRRTQDQFASTFAIMAMVVNAAFVSNLLPHAKALNFFLGICRGSKHDIKTDILKLLCQSGKCV